MDGELNLDALIKIQELSERYKAQEIHDTYLEFMLMCITSDPVILERAFEACNLPPSPQGNYFKSTQNDG